MSVDQTGRIGAINPLSAAPAQYQSVTRTAAAAKVQEEFMVIFYREMLKQAFKAPDLSVTDGEEKNGAGFSAAYSSEMMVEQLAREMIKSGQLRPDFLQGTK